MLFVVDVGFTTTRPVRPDEHVSRVHVEAETQVEAELIACAMVGRPGVEMPTSTKLVRVEL